MKVLSAIIGGVIGALLAIFFLANVGADWYTAQSEFQSPDGYEETYSTIYLAVIAGCTVLGYIIGRIIGSRIEGDTSSINKSFD